MISGLDFMIEEEAKKKVHKEKLEIVKGFLDMLSSQVLAEKFKITLEEVEKLRAELEKPNE